MICSEDWRETLKLLPYIWLRYSRKGVDSEAAKNYIFEKTGMVLTIYESGTLFVTNQKLTLEMLKEISDLEDVLEIAGDYTGNITARGPSHTHTDTHYRI